MQVYDKSSWFVSSKDVPKLRRSVILSSMFPSGKGYQDLGDSNCNVDMEDDITGVENEKAEDGIEALENPVMSESAEEVSDFPLEHCMRIMPHDQNTGAFFIAVLQKVSSLPGSIICNNALCVSVCALLLLFLLIIVRKFWLTREIIPSCNFYLIYIFILPGLFLIIGL